MCRVCEHPILAEIEAELVSCAAPDWRMLRRKYGVHHLALMRHKREHMKPATYGPEVSCGSDTRVNHDMARIEQVMDLTALAEINMQRVTENPLSQFKQAWRLAKDDRQLQQAMVAWLNEQIQADDMGLP
jgi:hypothetical protein